MRSRHLPLLTVAALATLSAGCKRTADAPLPQQALFPDVVQRQTPPPEQEMARAELMRAVEPDGERKQARDIPANVVVAGTLAGAGHNEGASPAAKPSARARAKGRKRRKPRKKRWRSFDDDWFRIAGTDDAAQVTRVELRDAPRCARLDVFSTGSKPLRSATWHRGVRPVIPGLRLDQGPLWIRVRCLVRASKLEGEPGEVGGAYRLAVSTRPRRIDEEREPNDRSTGDTQVLMLGQTIQALLAPRKDRDVFRLDLSAAEPGAAQMLSVTGAPGVDLEVSLLRDGEPVLVRRPKRGEGVVVPNLDVRRTGTAMTLQVTALRGQAPDAPYAATVRTMLPSGCTDAQGCPDKVPIEREPNDKRAQAMGIKAGSLISGVLDGRGDEDWYAIDGEPGQVVQVRLRAPEGLAVELAASHSSEPWLTLQGKADGERVTLSGWRTSKRRVFVRVRGVDGSADATALYFLRVSFLDEPDFEAPGTGPQALRPVAGAGGAPASTWRRAGVLLPAGDRDRFGLDWSARSTATKVRLSCRGDGAPGLLCEWKDAAGQSLAQLAAPDDGGVATHEAVLAPGAYSVEVLAQGERASNRPYVVAVVDDGPVAPPQPATPTAPSAAPPSFGLNPGIGAAPGGATGNRP